MNPANPAAIPDTWLLHVDRIALEAWTAAHPGVVVSAEVGEALRLATGLGGPRRPEDCLVRFRLAVGRGSVEDQVAAAWECGVARVVALPLRSRGETSTRRALATALAAGMIEAVAPFAADEPHFYVLGTDERALCGVATPRETGSPFAAGRFTDAERPSRAGAKLSEALAYADAFLGGAPRAGRWLELGAFPGGMTAVLAENAAYVTAVDRRERPEALAAAANLTWHACDVEAFDLRKSPQSPGSSPQTFDALVSDLNGPPLPAAQTVARLAATLAPHSLVIHTLKLSRWDELERDLDAVSAIFESAGLQLQAVRHFCANRRELTLFAKSQNETFR